MNIGRKPAGATYTAKRRVETWGEAEIIAYIDERTRAAGKDGIEYDEIERQILSDPWVEGWETRAKGLPALLVPVEPLNIRAAVRAERYELKLKGWNDCNEWIKNNERDAK